MCLPRQLEAYKQICVLNNSRLRLFQKMFGIDAQIFLLAVQIVRRLGKKC